MGVHGHANTQSNKRFLKESYLSGAVIVSPDSKHQNTDLHMDTLYNVLKLMYVLTFEHLK
jgi:hypothetical protein